ncbi:hypothetical protein [Nocardia sp. NPDC047038]|uniref:hypothetical protein n=1 Tax=Nocardia sp. NPDC047038 TaxID=3154338 RepID=UPI0033ED1ED2
MGKVKPSEELRRRMDAALAPGHEWTEQEQEYLTLAGQAADRAVVIQAQLDAELAREDPRPNSVVRLSAELRALERAQGDYVARLNPTVDPPKSERHRRAALSRWDRERRRG